MIVGKQIHVSKSTFVDLAKSGFVKVEACGAFLGSSIDIKIPVFVDPSVPDEDYREVNTTQVCSILADTCLVDTCCAVRSPGEPSVRDMILNAAKDQFKGVVFDQGEIRTALVAKFPAFESKIRTGIYGAFAALVKANEIKRVPGGFQVVVTE